MRGGWIVGLLLCGPVAVAAGDDIRWRPASTVPQKSSPAASTIVTPPPVVGLGQPSALNGPRNDDGIPVYSGTVAPAIYTASPIASSQSPKPTPGVITVQGYDSPPPSAPPGSTIAPLPPLPPPPPPPPPGGPDFGTQPGGGEGWGFFKKCWDKFECGSWTGSGRTCFQSDHCFDNMISPVTSPFLDEDPRALTEIRPIFIWQKTPSSNPVFNGGSNFFLGTQARVAVTERIDVVMNEIGGIWQNPRNPNAFFQTANGVSELRIGPKFTFLREETNGTVGALGLTFDIASGSGRVEQNTGSLSLAPYVSLAQSFGRSSFGNFNAMGTLGYNFSVNQQRSEFFYTTLHLDYDIAGAHKIYPLIEMNWLHYGRSGNNVNVNGFEGGDLFNFGAQGVAGTNDLTLAIGARYKFTEWAQLGAAVEFPLIGPKDLDGFRTTLDFILRY